MDVFTEITYLQYKEYRRIHGEKATAIPTMNLFTIKPYMDGNPNRAKSRIVALGNLERRIWSREDKYAPVLSSTASRLLVSMAVEDGRKLKQADCKNAFCNGILPDDAGHILEVKEDIIWAYTFCSSLVYEDIQPPEG